MKRNNEKWARPEKRIKFGTLYFHGKVPPKSNYPHSKHQYKIAIEKVQKAIAKINQLDNKQFFSISRAPISGE